MQFSIFDFQFSKKYQILKSQFEGLFIDYSLKIDNWNLNISKSGGFQ